MRRPPPVALALLPALLLCSPGAVRADYIATTFGAPGPAGAWAYYRAVGVGKGNSTTYVPLQADYQGREAFEGYVYYPGGGPADPSAGWIHREPSLYDEDTIRVFRTYLLADADVTLALFVGGDDGHSIYVNDVFLGGGGFAAPVEPTITLRAGEAVKVELLGYNGPGAWQLVFRRQDGGEVADTPGVHVSATGQFTAVPAPPAAALFGVGLVVLLARRKSLSG